MGNGAFKFWLLLLFSVTAPSYARAPRKLTAVFYPEFAPPQLRTLVRPPHYPDEEAFYKEFVAPLDRRIQREYTDAWRFHEIQIRYAATSWRHEYIQLGTMNTVDNGPYEWVVREDLARRVMRMRIDSAMRAYFAPPERATLRSAHTAIQQMNANRVSLSSNPSVGELRFGYDIFSDESRIEYAGARALEAGLYHPRLLGSLNGTGDFMGLTRFQVRVQPWEELPRTTFVYHLFGMIEYQFAKTLKPGITTELLLIRYARQTDAPKTQLLRFIFDF